MASTAASMWRRLNITHWDIHFYFDHTVEASVTSALEIHQALKKAFPSMKVFEPLTKAAGPHPMGMWEAHMVNEQQFGEAVAWLAFNRRDHSVLVHPNTTGTGPKGMEDDHSIHAMWLGTPLQLDLEFLRGYAATHAT